MRRAFSASEVDAMVRMFGYGWSPKRIADALDTMPNLVIAQLHRVGCDFDLPDKYAMSVPPVEAEIVGKVGARGGSSKDRRGKKPGDDVPRWMVAYCRKHPDEGVDDVAIVLGIEKELAEKVVGASGRDSCDGSRG